MVLFDMVGISVASLLGERMLLVCESDFERGGAHRVNARWGRETERGARLLRRG